ncbi:MAG TPA: fumarylacetoacetate hydrolase family protein, partial [Rhodoferax sp.]
ALNAAPYKGAPQAPAMYIKPANTRVTPGARIALPKGATAVEVGATIGLVMGRAAGRLSCDNALQAMAGVVLAADLSLPHDSYYRPAIREKCFDASLPMGTVQPLVDLGNLVLTTEIDGLVVEQRSLTDLVRNPAQLLVDVSAFMTLAEGDVLLTGVSYRAPEATAGSQVCISAQGLGTLQFSIASEGAQV